MFTSSWSVRAVVVGAILFLAYFHMSFYMDTSNDSETTRYGTDLARAVATGSIPTDESGRYTLLTGYATGSIVQVVGAAGSGAAPLRGYTVVRFLQGLALFASAYAFYRMLGLAWMTRLVGLMLLSISVTFGTLAPDRAFELDKITEAILYLLAGIALLRGRPGWLIPLSVLAVLNRETGILMPLMYLAAQASGRERFLTAVRSWQFLLMAALALSLAGVLIVMSGGVGLEGGIRSRGFSLETFTYANGGFALMPLLAALWVGSSPGLLKRLFWSLSPAWLILGLLTEPVRFGAYLLPANALLFIPIALLAVEAQVRWRQMPVQAGVPQAAP